MSWMCSCCEGMHDEPMEERHGGSYAPSLCGPCRAQVDQREELIRPLAAALFQERQLARRLLRELSERCRAADQMKAASALDDASRVLRDWDERAILTAELREALRARKRGW